MAIWDDPVLNSAFAEPKRHYGLDDKGVPTGEILRHLAHTVTDLRDRRSAVTDYLLRRVRTCHGD